VSQSLDEPMTTPMTGLVERLVVVMRAFEGSRILRAAC
jgi:hypothetical protein